MFSFGPFHVIFRIMCDLRIWVLLYGIILQWELIIWLRDIVAVIELVKTVTGSMVRILVWCVVYHKHMWKIMRKPRTWWWFNSPYNCVWFWLKLTIFLHFSPFLSNFSSSWNYSLLKWMASKNHKKDEQYVQFNDVTNICNICNKRTVTFIFNSAS